MEISSVARRSYDHRLKNSVSCSRNSNLFPELAIPKRGGGKLVGHNWRVTRILGDVGKPEVFSDGGPENDNADVAGLGALGLLTLPISGRHDL